MKGFLVFLSLVLALPVYASGQPLPRTTPPLCRVQDTPSVQLVWTENSPACTRPAHPVRLLAPMPDMELILMLNQANDILARSRLLMAGSTPCAPIRAFRFELASIDIGIDKLNVLEFDTGRHGTVQVAVRKYRHELLPWKVSCKRPR